MTGAQPTEEQWHVWEQDLVARLDDFGISRLADTTGLDTPGVPTASAVKPATTDVIWVYSGKGRSQEQARVTAIMECLERSGALWSSGTPWVTDTLVSLERTHEVWSPDRFTYRRRDSVRTDDPQAWVEATKLTGTPGRVMVPADLCFNGRRPAEAPASPFMLSTSNGLAASFDLDDALIHGLAEVIERDVVSCAEVRASHLGYRYLTAIAKRFGLSTSVLGGYEDNVDLALTIQHDSLPGSAQEIAKRYEAAGLDLVVKLLPNDFELPAFGVAAVQQADLTRHLGCAGYAVRTSSASALDSALLELAQTRATDLQGAREDRHEVEKQRLDEAPTGHWLATPGARAVSYSEQDVEPGLDGLLARCEQAGLPDVAYVAFPAWPGISVVRVVVPDAETWHVTGGWSSLGPRLREQVGRG
ncbi:YcaO-like family protein [Haloechinothrix halophila]|uniref:YcaO-like family protein n=1 Tax=Haloechinothrix halophila TaxID=1069073 RepID=UPI00042171E3|nr:YcaO-like family protein [Haloechinothrix halophila]